MKKIIHSNPNMQWHQAIQIAAHNYNTFPSAVNRYLPFLLHFGREDSNPLWNKLNPGNTVILQGDVTQAIHELHKLWKAHTVEIAKNRSKDDNKKITKDPPLKLYDRVLVQNHHNHRLEPKFHGDWKVVDFNSDRQVVVQNNAGDRRVMSTRHVKKATFNDMVFSTLDLFKPTWKT